MTIKNFEKKQIYPNPYQTRIIADGDPAIAELAASITEHGLQEIPTARPHPDKPGCVQLVKGHRRTAAWFVANPREPMPIDVQDNLDDRKMFDYNVIENSQRKDMTATEKAKQMALYMQTFKASQEEVGRLFGYSSQGAVSNVVRLLKLPEEIHPLIGVSVPERLARNLLGFSRAFPKDVINIANNIAKADDDDKEDKCDSGIRNLTYDKCKNLNGSGFDQSKPLKEAHPKFGVVPACRVCEWAVGNYCTRVECFNFKKKIEILRSAENNSLGLTVAKIGERVTVIFDGERERESFAKEAIKIKHESLRLIPSPSSFKDDDNWNNRMNREHVLHGREIALATTDLKALMTAVPKAAPPKKIDKAEAARLEKEEIKEQQREQELRDAQRKEVEMLKQQAAAYFAPRLPNDPTLLRLILSTTMSFDLDVFDKEKYLSGKKELAMRELLDNLQYNVDSIFPNFDADKKSSGDIDSTKRLFNYLAAEFKMPRNVNWYVPDNNVHGNSETKKKAKKK